jgi:hypothetical protein
MNHQHLKITNSNNELKTSLVPIGNQILLSTAVVRILAELEFLVIPNITGLIPATTIHSKTWNIPKNVIIADPLFATLLIIDILLGVANFFEVWSHQQLKLNQSY